MSGISWDDATEGVELPEFDGESQYLGKLAKKQLVESETPFRVTVIQLDQAGFSKTGRDPRWLLTVEPMHGQFPKGLLGMPCNPRRDPELAGAKLKLDAARKQDQGAFIGPVVLDIVGNKEFLVLRPAPAYNQGQQAPLAIEPPSTKHPDGAEQGDEQSVPQPPPGEPTAASVIHKPEEILSPDGQFKLVNGAWEPVLPPAPATEVKPEEIPANEGPKKRGRPSKAEQEAKAAAEKAAQQKAQPPPQGPVYGSAFCPDCNDTIEGELAPYTEGGFALLHRCPTTGLFKPLTQDVEVTSA